MGKPILIAFGANINPLYNLYWGLVRLHNEAGIQKVSTVWRTQPIPDPNGPESPNQDPLFLNGAIQISGQWEPFHLKKLLLEIEAGQQRTRSRNRYAPRSLDLDIAIMGSRILLDATLTIPDPDITSRPFLALPLAELAPDWLHPLEKISLRDLANRFGSAPEGMILDHEATRLLQTIPGYGSP